MNTNRVAVISDNATLVDTFRRAICAHGMPNENFEFFYSSKNNSSASLVERKCKPIDLKSDADLNYLFGNFQIAISAHCKQIFPVSLVTSMTCINIHPGLNPFNRGWYPQVFSIINSLPAGVTIHVIDEQIDHGPIIYQEAVEIDPADTSLDVYEKLIRCEERLIEKYLPNLVALNFETVTPKSEGNYNSIKDFKQLCRLDLNRVASLEEHINLLRALTHGEFRNAFFEKDGQRIYVRLCLSKNEGT